MSCPTCGSILIPIGPVGPQGPIGPTNPSVVDNKLVPAFTIANTLLTVLQTITIPANTLTTNGSKFIARTVFRFANNGNAKQAGIRIAGVTSSMLSFTNNGPFVMDLEVNRVGSLLASACSIRYADTVIGPNFYGSSLAVDFTNPIIVDAIAQNGVASANDIECDKLDVVKYLK
jgi:hypothetical protein